MRIAYFAHLNNGRASGVIQKVAGQAHQWRAAGHAVKLFVVTSDGDEPWLRTLGDIAVFRYGRRLSRLLAMIQSVRAIRAYRPSLVYMRADIFYPPMLWLPADPPLAIEVNTDDLKESALGTRIRARYNAVTRRFLLGRASAMIFVTTELSLLPSFARFPARRYVISNGVDLGEYPEFPAIEKGPPALVFIGTGGAPWHGIDKLCALAAMRKDWTFEIVGEQQASPSLPNVTWHGPLERDDLLPILARADVGVGTLALHRKSMNEASPLKVREYLAVGVPVLYGYADPDADELGEYVLRIANTPTNVIDELPRIDAFVQSARGRRVPRSAIAHIDVKAKERQRLELLGELAGT